MVLRKLLQVSMLMVGFASLVAMAAEPTDSGATKAGRPAPTPHPPAPKPTPPANPPVDPMAQALAKRNQATNHLKEIAMAIMMDESMNKQLTRRAVFANDGKPLLSWRVRMLPYLENAALYEQFHLDEPWDSENNKKLVEKMPEVFKNPEIETGAGLTVFQAVVGPGAAFEADKQLTFSDFSDGTNNTIAVVEVAADKAAPWTKPADWEFDPKHPAQGLATLEPGSRFLALYMDGHIDAVPTIGSSERLKGWFTRAGGDNADPGKLRDKFDATKSH